MDRRAAGRADRREVPRSERDYFIRIKVLGEDGANFHGRTRNIGRKGVYAVVENVTRVPSAGAGVEVRIYREDSGDLKGFTVRANGIISRVEALSDASGKRGAAVGLAITFASPLDDDF